MPRRSLVLLALLPWLATAAPMPAEAAAPAPVCQFILGFQTLHDLDPTDIGDCLDNQAFAANGDAQQHTTKGLLAWRKADNWTAFTNGYWTWINGPGGLAKRLNTQRFPWEANPDHLPLAGSGSPAASPAAALPGVAGFARVVSADQGFSINLPNGWERTAVIAPMAVATLSPAGSPLYHGRALVGVAVETLPTGMTLSQYFLQAKDQVLNGPGITLHDTGQAQVNGHSALYLKYCFMAGPTDTTAISYMVVNGGRVYTITLMAATDQFDALNAGFLSVLQSFRLQ